MNYAEFTPENHQALLHAWQTLFEQQKETENTIATMNQTIANMTKAQESLADANVRIAELYGELEDAYEQLARSQEIENLNKQLIETNQEVLATNEELTQALDTIKEQTFEIEKKTKKIIDSLNYAQRIQQAMLPFHEEIAKHIGKDNFFILYMPKDIVSGDFYWFGKHQHYEVVIVADCTGHGIPGAFMSMIGNQLLYEIVIQQGIVSPDKILCSLHNGVRRVLKQAETNNNDGMEIVVLTIDKPQSQVLYAGAMNPIFYRQLYENVQTENFSEIKATKKAIGGSSHEEYVFFDLHIINLTQPTIFYLCTDGYQDQFGGINKRKFMAKHFRELLSSLPALSLTTQHQILKNTINEWINGQNQTDDITILGIRVN